MNTDNGTLTIILCNYPEPMNRDHTEGGRERKNTLGNKKSLFLLKKPLSLP